jgi:hypothetical protein
VRKSFGESAAVVQHREYPLRLRRLSQGEPATLAPRNAGRAEEEKPLGDEEAFMRGEMESIEELEKRDRKRLVGDDDLFDADLDDESEI